VFLCVSALSCKSGSSGGGGDDDNRDSGSNPTGYDITGRVRSSFTGSTVAGAQVILKQGGQTVETATTGTAGAYSITHIGAGSYTIEASTPIYKTVATSAFTLSANTPNMDIISG
jgi:hypothetical protein